MNFLVHQSLLNYANNVLFSTKLCNIAFNNMLFKKKCGSKVRGGT